MDRSQKTDAVAQLNNVFNEAGVVVVTRNLGLTVAESTDLRSKMREAGATYQVAKNRLAKIALKDTDYAGIEEYLSGPTALAYSEDPVAAAKAVVEFAKTNDRIEVVGGSMGSQVLDEAGVKALASMPSLDELRARLERRGEDSAEVIELRLRNAAVEMQQAPFFDFVIINESFDLALFDLKAIVHAQRLKYAAQRRSRSAVFAALNIT